LVSGRVVHIGAVLEGEDDLGCAVGTSSSEFEGALSAGVDTSIAAESVRSRKGQWRLCNSIVWRGIRVVSYT